MSTLTHPQLCTLATFLAHGDTSDAEETARELRAMLIQSVYDNGFSAAAVKAFPSYPVPDSVTVRTWVRDVAVWLYNLSEPERQWLLKQEFIWS